MRVTHIPLIAGLADLPGARLAAAAAVQHGADARGTVGPAGATLAGPLAELQPLSSKRGAVPGAQLPSVLSPAQGLGEREKHKNTCCSVLIFEYLFNYVKVFIYTYICVYMFVCFTYVYVYMYMYGCYKNVCYINIILQMLKIK